MLNLLSPPTAVAVEDAAPLASPNLKRIEELLLSVHALELEIGVDALSLLPRL